MSGFFFNVYSFITSYYFITSLFSVIPFIPLVWIQWSGVLWYKPGLLTSHYISCFTYHPISCFKPLSEQFSKRVTPFSHSTAYISIPTKGFTTYIATSVTICGINLRNFCGIITRNYHRFVCVICCFDSPKSIPQSFTVIL